MKFFLMFYVLTFSAFHLACAVESNKSGASEVFKFVPQLSENFRAQYSDHVKNAPRMRGMNLVSKFVYTEKDFEDLSAWNVNLVRWQMSRNYKVVGANRDFAEYDKWIDSEIEKLKVVSKWAGKNGIKIIIEMHTPIGGTDKNNDMQMFYEDVYAKHFVEVWRKLARGLKGVGEIWAYDIVNEPVQRRPSSTTDYLKVQYDAALEIRKINPDIPLIVASANWSNPDSFSYLYPLPIKDVIYTVHMYMPHKYTHQGIGGNTTMADIRAGKTVKYPTAEFSKKDMARVLEPVREFQKKYGAKIFAGEFGLVRWCPNGGEYVEDCIDTFESYGWDWANHAFRETYDGFSSEHSDDVNVKEKDLENPRLKALLKGFEKNKKLF